MSAYKLTDLQFQTIANCMYTLAMSKQSSHCFTIRKHLGLDQGTEGEEVIDYVRSHVRDLYNLNRLALVTRYSEPYDSDDKAQFVPRSLLTVADREFIQVLKTLRYQCAEYITSDTHTFDKLGRLIADLCENLFNDEMRK